MDVTALPRNDYPRPQFMRGDDTWRSLNGKWEFELDLSNIGLEGNFHLREHLKNEITVPFVPESKLSGIGFEDFIPAAWYKRSFDISKEENKKILIHFGAVNHYARVYINSCFAGDHRGGYTPFTIDITNLCRNGENTVTVYVENNVGDPLQPTGKQSTSFAPHGCFYSRCTGIWQSVWLEFVPKDYIRSIKLIPDVANSKIDVSVRFGGDMLPQNLRAVAAFDGNTVCEKEFSIGRREVTFSLDIPDCKLWNIGEGNLYDLTVTAGDDMIVSYFGMREISVSGNKILLNGKSIFQRLVLDQGYYEGGIYTPFNAEEFEKDIALAQAAGFNGARMHMKVFDPAYIAAADRAGFLLWEEYPVWGLDYEKKGIFEAVAAPWREVIERDISAPSIIVWCPFNETWSTKIKELLSNICLMTKSLDPSRPVIDTSGFVHLCDDNVFDIYDVHDYEQEPDVFKTHYSPLIDGKGEVFINTPEGTHYDGKKPYFVSEYGGTFWEDDQSLEDGKNQTEAWGYGDRPKNAEEFLRRFKALSEILLENPEICGFCYTQLTDVMQEKNGLFRFNRDPKFDIEHISNIISKKAAIED